MEHAILPKMEDVTSTARFAYPKEAWLPKDELWAADLMHIAKQVLVRARIYAVYVDRLAKMWLNRNGFEELFKNHDALLSAPNNKN